jgi:hypothetical protein
MEKVMHVTEYKYLPLLPENMCKKLRIKGWDVCFLSRIVQISTLTF